MTTLALLSAMILGCADAGLTMAAAAPTKAPEVEVAASSATTAPAPSSASETAKSALRETGLDEAREALVFAGETDQAVADKVIGYLEEITTFTADFTQVAPSGAISTGKFYLRRPGLLRFQYDAPSPILIVATGGTVFVRDEALETTDSYPVGRTPLKFLLRKKVDFGNFEIAGVDRGVDSVAVTFASNEEETEGQISIILDAPTLKLREWIVRDPQNGVTIVSLDNIVEGQQIANRLFAAPEAATPFLKN